MSLQTNHRWTFVPRFRKGAFGWRSQPAIIRIREALSEIKKTARKNPILGAEGTDPARRGDHWVPRKRPKPHP
jgi:hypothetical protein